MKNFYLILLSVFAFLNTAMAQELKVKSFSVAINDLSASVETVPDKNGDPCALGSYDFPGLSDHFGLCLGFGRHLQWHDDHSKPGRCAAAQRPGGQTQEGILLRPSACP